MILISDNVYDMFNAALDQLAVSWLKTEDISPLNYSSPYSLILQQRRMGGHWTLQFASQHSDTDSGGRGNKLLEF